MTTIQQGTIISGTMQPRDLIPAFSKELKRVAPDRYERWADINVPFADGAFDEDDTEGAGWALQELEDELNAVCPEGWYFGNTEGDGTDYGWWVDPNVEWECANG